MSTLIDGFMSGWNAGGKLMAGFENRKIANAKPEVTPGEFPEQSPEQTQQLVADQMANDSGGAEAVRIARASAGPRTAAQYAMLGTKQDTPFTPEQESRARQMAMAGVLEKHGDIEGGSRLRDRVQQADTNAFNMGEAKKRSGREEQLFDWQKGDRDRLEQERRTEDAYKSERQSLFNSGTYGQKNASFVKSWQQFEQDKAAYDKKLEAGDTMAVAPVAPQRPTVTVGESLLDHATMLGHDVRYGKADSAALVKFAEMSKQVNDEGYLKSLRLAQSGAPLTQVVAQFNANGSIKIDPASIVSDKQVTREGGVKSRLITFKDQSGQTQTIDTYAEMNSLGKAGELFDQAVKVHTMANQDRQSANAEKQTNISGGHLGIARANRDDGAPEREAKNAESRLRIKLAETEDPAEQAKLEGKIAALRSGSRGGAANVDPASVKEARALVASGAAPDMATALEAVVGKADKIHQRYIESEMKRGMPIERAVATADKAMTASGYTKHAGRWVKSGANPTEAAIAFLRKNPDQASAFDSKFGPGAARRVLFGD